MERLPECLREGKNDKRQNDKRTTAVISSGVVRLTGPPLLFARSGAKCRPLPPAVAPMAHGAGMDWRWTFGVPWRGGIRRDGLRGAVSDFTYRAWLRDLNHPFQTV